MVETAEQAAELVAATRYPPDGERGVGHVLARASRWGQVKDYLARADDEICLMLQVESQQALDNLEAIAAVEGVDGVFIWPCRFICFDGASWQCWPPRRGSGD